MPTRTKNRSQIEALLTLSCMGLVLCALLFVYLAKRTPLPNNVISLNDATAPQIAAALEIDAPTSQQIVAYREAHGGFRHCEELFDLTQKQVTPDPLPPVKKPKSNAKKGIKEPVAPKKEVSSLPATSPLPLVPLLSESKIRPLLPRLIVRSPGAVFWKFAGATAFLLIALLFVPPFLRSKASGDPYLFPLSLTLGALGMALMYSIKDPLRDIPAFQNHLLGLILGVIVYVIAARIAPAARFRLTRYPYLYVFASAALIGALALFGGGPGGVKLRLFFVQPVEIVKILLVFFLAAYLHDRAALIADSTPRKTTKGTSKHALPRRADIAPLAVMYGFALALFIVVKDLGPGLLLFTTALAALYLTTGRSGFVGVGIGLLVLAAYVGYGRHFGVFATRVDMWRSPFANTHANGLQLGQALWGMATGGWEGSGLGMGSPGTIPRAGSDMAFAAWTEETGIFGGLLVLTLYGILIWRGCVIAMKANTEFDRTLALCLTALFGLQTLLILGGVTGLIPLSGISLPFLSYGNSALVADFLLLGLLRGISAPPTGGVGRPAPSPGTILAIRRFSLGMTAAIVGVIGIIRLGTLQLLHADEIATRAIVTPDADKISRPHINPRLALIARNIARGSIYDRNGLVLATSRPEERRKEITKAIRDPLEAKKLIESRRRYYPFGENCAHLVGYVDPAIGGPFGLEKGYDDDLRGFANYADLLTDYRNRNLPGYRPREGKDLYVTLDANLQKTAMQRLAFAANALTDGRTGKPKDRGAFVLLDATNGDVLVSASLPTFDPNRLTPEQIHEFVSGTDAKLEARLVNRATGGVYPPGSTLKIATTAAALDSTSFPDALNFKADANQTEERIAWKANGTSYVRRNTRDDQGDPNFGVLTLPNAFRVSSNIYFAKLAVAIGSNNFHEALESKYHFRYVPKQAKFDADLPDIGYGQGRMVTTPLEMARLSASVAQNGEMMRPRFATRLAYPTKKEGERKISSESMGKVMSPQTATTVRGMMRSVVLRGTAKGVFDEEGLEVAGKTGTAQNDRGDREPHSWFVGMAPFSEAPGLLPRYAFACVVENGGYGKRVAAIVCRDMVKALARKQGK